MCEDARKENAPTTHLFHLTKQLTGGAVLGTSIVLHCYHQLVRTKSAATGKLLQFPRVIQWISPCGLMYPCIPRARANVQQLSTLHLLSPHSYKTARIPSSVAPPSSSPLLPAVSKVKRLYRRGTPSVTQEYRASQWGAKVVTYAERQKSQSKPQSPWRLATSMSLPACR